MPLFTRQFIKDLFWSIVFIFSIYGIINNPYAHPIAQPTPGNWSIEQRQYPLLFGIAGHNYLVLLDQDGSVVRELHGLATDPITNTWKDFGTKKTDILKVWEFNTPRSYEIHRQVAGIILLQGSENEMKDRWIQGETCKERINNKNILYPVLGVRLTGETTNSNSVAYTLALCMGVTSEHIGWITPGSEKNLLDDKR